MASALVMVRIPGVGLPGVVKRTRRGDRIVSQVLQVTTELEARWRQEIGPRDYDLFRDVLIRLVAGAKHSASPTASGSRARAAE
jgi:hypothetical protein